MLEEARFSMPPAAALAVKPSQHRVLDLDLEAAALRVSSSLAAGAMLWSFPAALCACSLGGALYVLGGWICGKGSSVASAGQALLLSALVVAMPLFSLFMMLFMVRAFAYAKLVVQEEKSKKQCPERVAAPLLSKFRPIAVSLLLLNALMVLAIWMKDSAEEGSLGWRLGAVLLDIVLLGASFLTAFVVVPFIVNMMTISSKNDEDIEMQ